MWHRIFAPAVFLPVEVLFFSDPGGGVLGVVGAPVAGPEGEGGVPGGGLFAGGVDLVHVLPAADPVGRGQGVKPVFMGVKSGAFEPHLKTGAAALAAFGLRLETFHAGHPVLRVIVRVDKRDPAFSGVRHNSGLAPFVFIARVDVRVIKEKREDPLLTDQRVNDRAGAGGTTGVKKQSLDKSRLSHCHHYPLCYTEVNYEKLPSDRHLLFVNGRHSNGGVKRCGVRPAVLG